jgi:hypothetical protein
MPAVEMIEISRRREWRRGVWRMRKRPRTRRRCRGTPYKTRSRMHAAESVTTRGTTRMSAEPGMSSKSAVAPSRSVASTVLRHNRRQPHQQNKPRQGYKGTHLLNYSPARTGMTVNFDLPNFDPPPHAFPCRLCNRLQAWCCPHDVSRVSPSADKQKWLSDRRQSGSEIARRA